MHAGLKIIYPHSVSTKKTQLSFTNHFSRKYHLSENFRPFINIIDINFVYHNSERSQQVAEVSYYTDFVLEWYILGQWMGQVKTYEGHALIRWSWIPSVGTNQPMPPLFLVMKSILIMIILLSVLVTTTKVSVRFGNFQVSFFDLLSFPMFDSCADNFYDLIIFSFTVIFQVLVQNSLSFILLKNKTDLFIIIFLSTDFVHSLFPQPCQARKSGGSDENHQQFFQ